MSINWTSIIIIINNYFHDLATALLLSSAVILWVLGRQAEKGGAAERRALANAYPTLVKFAQGAFVWIILGGIPRTIFFTRYEWDPGSRPRDHPGADGEARLHGQRNHRRRDHVAAYGEGRARRDRQRRSDCCACQHRRRMSRATAGVLALE